VSGLVLSIFPGIDLLGRAFEEAGFCVVRGPDLLWGGDIHAFHPPAGKFDGVIGGPPCQHWSPLANINRAQGRKVAPDLIPEFERVVRESMPVWFVMENVVSAPIPKVPGYIARPAVLNNRMFGGEQNRERRFTLGTHGGKCFHAGEIMRAMRPTSCTWEPAVTSTSGGRRVNAKVDINGRMHGRQGRAGHLRKRNQERENELQGLPAEFLLDAPFTVQGRKLVVANGVPLAMGRAVAKAVRRAMNGGSPSEGGE